MTERTQPHTCQGCAHARIILVASRKGPRPEPAYSCLLRVEPERTGGCKWRFATGHGAQEAS